MEREQASQLITSAIDLVVKNDRLLLDLDVSERALSYRLAHYMSLAPIMREPLSVDCEYNRHFRDPKRLRLESRRASDRELRATTVFPDIVVHERNSDEHNLLVLELKKPDANAEDIEYDICKLRGFREQLGYKHAVSLILGCDQSGNLVMEMEWVDD